MSYIYDCVLYIQYFHFKAVKGQSLGLKVLLDNIATNVVFDHYLEDSLKRHTCMKRGDTFLEICSYSWGTGCSNSLEKLSHQWIQQGSPSEVLLWVLQENSISVLKDEVLYRKDEELLMFQLIMLLL